MSAKNIALSIETLKRATEWLVADDKGVSSETIVRTLMGLDKPSSRNYGNYPRDPADFGRCHRLLEKIPEFKTGLREVARRNPDWANYVQNWDRLTALYLRDKDAGVSKELLRVLQGLSPYAGARTEGPVMFRLDALSGDGLTATGIFSVVAKYRDAAHALFTTQGPVSACCVALAIPKRFFPLLPESMPTGLQALSSTVTLSSRSNGNPSERYAFVVGDSPFRLQIGDSLVQINNRFEASVTPCGVAAAPAQPSRALQQKMAA